MPSPNKIKRWKSKARKHAERAEAAARRTEGMVDVDSAESQKPHDASGQRAPIYTTRCE